MLPVLALGLHLICGLSALNCSELKWRENPVDVFEKFETNFSLECGNDSASADEYMWTKDDNPVIESSTVKYRGSSLQFLNFSESDEGLYKCLRLGSYCRNVDINPLLKTIRLRQPRLTPFTPRGNKVHRVQEYTYVRLECSDKGVMIGDNFHYNWDNGYFNQIRHEHERMYTDLTGNLHITPVLREDENLGRGTATFVCFVSDPLKLLLGRYGNNNKLTVENVAIAPQSKPILKHKSENATAPLYKTAKLECVFSGYHANVSISYSWFLPNGSPVPAGDKKYQFPFNNRRLYILDVSESDGGVYHCQAENGVGVSTKEEVKLEVTCN